MLTYLFCNGEADKFYQSKTKEKSMDADFLDNLIPRLPYLLSRKDIGRFFGSIISPRYLANLDSKKLGPKKTIVGRKVSYTREDFIEWLKNRIKK